MTSRQFSIPTVLRMVPNEILGQVFERLGHGDLGICWTGLKEREVEPVLRAARDHAVMTRDLSGDAKLLDHQFQQVGGVLTVQAGIEILLLFRLAQLL